MRGAITVAAAAVLMSAGSVVGCHLVLGLESAESLAEEELCGNAQDCDDKNPCTNDTCETVCVHTPLDGLDLPRENQVDGDCRRAHCSHGLVEQRIDDNDLPDDQHQCTNDLCNAGVPTFNPIAGGSACRDDGGVVCNATGQCVECYSNTDCTSPNTCGGGGVSDECGCTPTDSCVSKGLTCGFISDQTCGGPAIACNNGVQDGNETDVDCGGNATTCSVRCEAGKKCATNNDCSSSNCTMNTCSP